MRNIAVNYCCGLYFWFICQGVCARISAFVLSEDSCETQTTPRHDLPFVLSFASVMNLDDLTRRGLYLSDIPLHDATRDLVLLGEQFREEYKLTQELEILTDRLQHTLRALEDEKKKTDRSDAPFKLSNGAERRTN